MDFKKIKGIFVESTDEPQKQTSQPATPSDAKANVEQAEKRVEKPSAKIDSKILDSLVKAIEANNLPGEDYFEFTEALRAMKDLPLDETLKIQTVMATLSTKGLTKLKVIDSASYYIKILENEKAKFYEAFKQEVDKQINKKNEEVLKLEAENKSKAEQIANLTKEIEANKDKIAKVRSGITTSNEKFTQTEDNFKATYSYMVDQITSNVTKIKNL